METEEFTILSFMKKEGDTIFQSPLGSFIEFSAYVEEFASYQCLDQCFGRRFPCSLKVGMFVEGTLSKRNI